MKRTADTARDGREDGKTNSAVDIFCNLDKGWKRARSIDDYPVPTRPFESVQNFTNPNAKNIVRHCIPRPEGVNARRAGRGLLCSRAGSSTTTTNETDIRQKGVIIPKLLELPFKIKQKTAAVVLVVTQLENQNVGGEGDEDLHDSGNDSPTEQREERGELLESEEVELHAGESEQQHDKHDETDSGEDNNEPLYEPDEGEIYIEDEEDVEDEYRDSQSEQSDDDSFQSESEEHENEEDTDSSEYDEGEKGRNGDNGEKDSWFQVDLDALGGIQMGVVEDALLWSCSVKPEGYVVTQQNEQRNQGQEQQNSHSSHQEQTQTEDNDDDFAGVVQFYNVLADNLSDLQFKVVASQVIKGTVIRRAKLVEYVKENQQFRYLVMLTNANELLYFDVIKKTFGKVFKLETSDVEHPEDLEYLLQDSLEDPLEGAPDLQDSQQDPQLEDIKNPNFFHEIEILDESGQIVVVEKRADGNVDSVVVFPFPPDWKKIYVINFYDLKFELTIRNGNCFILQNLIELTVLPWAKFVENAIPIVPMLRRRPINSMLTITNEWVISVLRKNKKMRMNLVTPNPRLLGSLKPPLVLIDTPDGKEFHELTSLLKNTASSAPIHNLEGNNGALGDEHTKVILFPDDTSRALVRHRMMNDYQVLSFRRHTNGIISTQESTPFDELTVRSSLSSCCMPPQKKVVLAMGYCKKFKLLCVLFAYKDKFNINFYEPLDLTLVKEMRFVRRVTSRMYSIDHIKSAYVSFGSTLLFVLITFDPSGQDDDEDDDEPGTFSELYLRPLTLEPIQKLK